MDFQVKQAPNAIYAHQSKYIKKLLKRFGYEKIELKSTLMNGVIELTIKEEYKSCLCIFRIEEVGLRIGEGEY